MFVNLLVVMQSNVNDMLCKSCRVPLWMINILNKFSSLFLVNKIRKRFSSNCSCLQLKCNNLKFEYCLQPIGHLGTQVLLGVTGRMVNSGTMSVTAGDKCATMTPTASYTKPFKMSVNSLASGYLLLTLREKTTVTSLFRHNI